MEMVERLKLLKQFCYESVCRGKRMKAPQNGPDGRSDDLLVAEKEPEVFIGMYPRRKNGREREATRVAPSILFIPGTSLAERYREKRWDKYQNVKRQREMSAELNAQFLFTMYDPGLRIGETIADNTEDAILSLVDWMMEWQRTLIGNKGRIAGTDLFVYDDSTVWSLLSNDESLDDRRPYYFGVVQASFGHYSNKTTDPELESILG